jgi:hypothetical protein
MDLRSCVSLLAICLIAAPASATTYVVRPDGAGDFPTLQAAIDGAQDGDVIELADGTFAGPGNRDVHWTSKTLTLRSQSGDASRCVIDCGGSPTAYHFALDVSGAGDASVLGGITVTGGYTPGYGAVTLQWTSLTVQDCIFRGNRGISGGAVTTDYYGDPVLLRCVFRENLANSGGAFCI